MKKMLCLATILILVCTGCAGRPAQEDTPPEITTAQAYCREFPDADLIVADDGAFYVEATKVDWVTALDLQDATPVATVERSEISDSFAAWDATTLPAGTPVARHNVEETVLIADRDGELIPYLAYES